MITPALGYVTEVPTGEAIAAKLAAEGIMVCPTCIGPLHADGGCRGCEADADPAWAAAWGAYCDAINRAEDCEAAGLPYPDAEQDRRDERTMRRYELAQRLAEWDAVTPANGCCYCGELEWEHGVRCVGRHPLDRCGYTTPSDRTRLLRMLARRDAADARLYRAVARRFEALGGVAQ